MHEHTSTDTDTRTRKESTLIQRIYYHNKRKRTYAQTDTHIHHTTHIKHQSCDTPVHTPHTTLYKAPLAEKQMDILTWWRTWVRRMHFQTCNGTVRIGNRSAWGLGWAWNLHGAQTRLLCKKPSQKTSEGTQKLFQIPPKTIPRDHPKTKKHLVTAQARKKPILGSRVPHHARQRKPNWTSKLSQDHPKCKICTLYQKT